jgi:AbrB family looped-hinge helix DNA binding protein
LLSQFGADVVIQGKSCAHITKLALRHHDVKRLECCRANGFLFQRIMNSALPSLLPKAMPCAMFNGMTLKIDKAGRVILPKPVRDRLGLHESSDLEILKEDSHFQSLRLQL